jgi:hypothetical protein
MPRPEAAAWLKQQRTALGCDGALTLRQPGAKKKDRKPARRLPVEDSARLRREVERRFGDALAVSWARYG